MSQPAPLIIQGGTPLFGTIAVQPSKNAALPMIVASLLSAEPVTLHGIPRLSDIHTILDIVASLGTRFEWSGPNTVTLHTPELISTETPYALVSKMRASFIVMGALLSRAGEATVSLPGGCAFGHRPVDQHLKAFRAMGVALAEDAGSFRAVRPQPLSGRYTFEMLTVGATQNAILAATLGTGTVVLEHASIDTDVVDMVNFLNSLGARISGAGTHTITIEGVARLSGGEYTVIPDRIEAGTWMIAAAATRSRLTLTNVVPSHLRALSGKLHDMGAQVLEGERELIVDARGALVPVNVTTAAYPGFPTDVQPQMAALLATVPGTSAVTDPVYPDRVTHVSPLLRMGADIAVQGHTQLIRGGAPLRGASVKAADIRAGAALIVAALAADGETIIDGMTFVNRGYELIAERLGSIGALVRQEEDVFAVAMD